MKIKWGVIGCGGIADRRTLPGMMLADNSELIAVMDANKAAADNCKEKYNAKYAFDNEENHIPYIFVKISDKRDTEERISWM